MKIVTPNKIGQVVRFHSPNEDEDPNQLYVVLEIIEDGEMSRISIQALNTEFLIPPCFKVLLSDVTNEK